MVCRHLAIITHNLLNSDKTHGVIYNSGVGAVGLTSSKKSDFANQNLCDGGCHILGGVCQLAFFLEELSQQGMNSLNNQTAQLVGTSWD